MRLSCFVDDPIVALKGCPERQRKHACAIVLTWAALGFPLALSKGQFGSCAKWIGFAVEVSPTTISATLKQELVDDIKEHLILVAKLNVVPTSCSGP